jgi:uncharacterized membrane protein
MTIRSPIEWGLDQLASTNSPAAGAPKAAPKRVDLPEVTVLHMRDLLQALRRGAADAAESRTYVVVLCLIYPILGFMLARIAFGYAMLPLIFPLMAGFTLVGPFASVGLAEMSRQSEQGKVVGWADAFAVFRAQAFDSVLLFGLLLCAIFASWLVVANLIYAATLGPDAPAGTAAFLHDTFSTLPGWVMIILGCDAGFAFAVLVLAISVVSFPLLLDQNTSVRVAILTSLRVCVRNPMVVAAWGLIIAALVAVGSLPALLGLAIVMPVLGHASWHLYRMAVRP